MRLSELQDNQSGVILKVHGRGAFRKRIMEMGFVKGKPIEVVRNAPLKDPIEYKIMGYEVSLRRADAALIEIGHSDTVSDEKFNGTSIDEFHDNSTENGRKSIHIALIGNPNSGKTSLFNHVSGANEKVGNYAGVTVDAKYAEFEHKGYSIFLTDLPGTYSISAYSPEEMFVRNHIMESSPDILINVIDASNLERNLFLTTQLIDMDIKMLIALNMYDELLNSGARFNYPELSRMIGIPIIPTISKKGTGLDELFDRAVDLFEGKETEYKRGRINYGAEIEKSVLKAQLCIPDGEVLTNVVSPRFIALKALEKDKPIMGQLLILDKGMGIMEKIKTEIARLEQDFQEDTETILTDSRYGFIAGAIKETYRGSPESNRKSTDLIDNLLTHRLFGIPVFIFFMWFTFQMTFTLGEYPMQWIEWLVGAISTLADAAMKEGPLKALLIDGIIGGVGGVIVFLPNILILFFFISLMEDTGYMARAAFIMDKVMHKMGLHGKSFIPLLMGFGCNVPAIMATRTIENRGDRILTMLITPFMSCSARFPVYILFASAFFPNHAGTVIFLIYIIGIVLAVIMSMLFKKVFFRKHEAPFVMELPPYRIPTLRNTSIHMWGKGKQYLQKMGGVILVASIIIWALGYFPREVNYSVNYDEKASLLNQHYEAKIHSMPSQTTQFTDTLKTSLNLLETEKQAEQLEKSYIGRMGKSIEPLIQPLGFDWKMGVSLLTGLVAKEIVVSSMGVLYQANVSGNDETEHLIAKLQAQKYKDGPKKGQTVITPLVAFSFMAFILIYFPCVAVVAAINKESGHWKWPLFTSVFSTLLAWVVSFIVFQLGNLF